MRNNLQHMCQSASVARAQIPLGNLLQMSPAGCCKRIEEVVVWIEIHAGIAKMKVRSLPKVEAVFTCAAVA